MPKVGICGPDIAFYGRDEVQVMKTLEGCAIPFQHLCEHYFSEFYTHMFNTNKQNLLETCYASI